MTLFRILLLFSIFITSSGHASPLSKHQILSDIVGKTILVKKLWMEVKVTYAHDGSVKVDGPIVTGKGAWHFEGDRLCMVMENKFPITNSCIAIEHIDGDQYRNNHGVILSVIDPPVE